MATHVRTTIRYDGPALAGHEMDVQDLAPALLALADIIQIANRKFNGDSADIRVLVNADVEQRCFQIDLSLVQSVLDVAKGFLARDDVKTALDIAKAVGIVGGATATLFKLVKWLGARKAAGTEFNVTREGGTTTFIDARGATINVDNSVYILASDPDVIERAKRVVKPLERPGYDTLEFVEGDAVVDTVTADEAKDIAAVPSTVLDPSHEDVSTITGHLRIKSPQYEGNAKWSVLWGGRAIDVTMPPDFVRAFQSNRVAAPPNTILTVEMEQRVTLDETGKAVGSPAFTVIAVKGVTPPPMPTEQLDWVTPRDRYAGQF